MAFVSCDQIVYARGDGAFQDAMVVRILHHAGEVQGRVDARGDQAQFQHGIANLSVSPVKFLMQNPTQLPLNGRRIVQVKQAGAGEAKDRFTGSAKQQG